MMNINMARFGSDMWIMVTSGKTVQNAVDFTMLIYVCYITNVRVSYHINMLFLTKAGLSKKTERGLDN
jgi:hypothetical protein